MQQPSGAKPHTYVVLLYSQSGDIDVTTVPPPLFSHAGRTYSIDFPPKEFAAEYGLDLLAATFFSVPPSTASAPA